MSSGCPAAGFPVVAALALVPLFFVPLPGRRLLYKAPFPLDLHIWGICPLVLIEINKKYIPIMIEVSYK
jgi:Synergist-CTERM protein sorting domain-containing protein